MIIKFEKKCVRLDKTATRIKKFLILARVSCVQDTRIKKFSFLACVSRVLAHVFKPFCSRATSPLYSQCSRCARLFKLNNRDKYLTYYRVYSLYRKKPVFPVRGPKHSGILTFLILARVPRVQVAS